MASWKDLPRHHLSGEYKDITGPAWYRFCLKFKKLGFLADRPIILHEHMVLDGWQRLRACIELDIEPTFAPMPEGITPEDYVEAVNDERRHETTAERTERIERIAERRKAGESLRTIAEAEGVSKTQVIEDLKDGGQGGCPPLPPDGRITGKDGVQQPATKPKILCSRCIRVGEVKHCPMCEELRDKKPVTPPKPDTSAPAVDAFGTPLPKNCKKAYLDPWIQEAIDFLGVTEENVRLMRLADGMNKRKGTYPFMMPKDFVDGVGMVMNTLDDLLTHLKDCRPAGVCPSCEGKGCSDCKMCGMVPRELHAKLLKAKK